MCHLLWGGPMQVSMHKLQAVEQINMEICHVAMAAQCSFRSIKNHAPRNISLKTWTLKPTTHQNMSSFGMQLGMRFDAQVARALETYPHQNM